MKLQTADADGIGVCEDERRSGTEIDALVNGTLLHARGRGRSSGPKYRVHNL